MLEIKYIKKIRNKPKHQGKWGEVAITYMITENQSKVDKQNKYFFIWKTGKQYCCEWHWINSLGDIHCHQQFIEHCNICTIERDLGLSTRLKCKVWITLCWRVIDSCWCNFTENKNVPKPIVYIFFSVE